MIKITMGDLTGRNTYIVDENKTLSQVAMENGVNLVEGSTNVNGATLAASEHNKTLAELGVQDGAYILSYPKAQGN